jgi:hypothetical protein
MCAARAYSSKTSFLTFVVSHYVKCITLRAVCMDMCMESAPPGRCSAFSWWICWQPAMTNACHLRVWVWKGKRASLISLFACAKMCLEGDEICSRLLYDELLKCMIFFCWRFLLVCALSRHNKALSLVIQLYQIHDAPSFREVPWLKLSHWRSIFLHSI